MEGALILALAAFSAFWLVRRVAIQSQTGGGWDTYAFLANASSFAGRDIGYTEPDRPPMLSLITSLIFRLGFVSEEAIFWVDAALLGFGLIGFYLLLRLRLSPVFSAAGCLLLLLYPAVQQWTAVGYSDLAGVSFGIWAIYLLYRAVESDPRWHLLAWPTAMAAFLTRNTMVLLLLPFLLLLVFRGNWRQAPWALSGMGLGLALPWIPVLLEIGAHYHPVAQLIAPGGALGNLAASGQLNIQALRYLMGLPEILTGVDHPLVLAVGLAGITGIVLHLTRRRGERSAAPLVAAALVYLALFLSSPLSLRQAGILALAVAAAWFLRARSDAKVALDITVAAWFLSQFDFHTYFAGQQLQETVWRYFIPMAPGLTYLLLLGLSELARSARGLGPWWGRLTTAGSLGVISVFLATAGLWSVAHLKPTPDFHRSIVGQITWFKAHYPDWKSDVIYSDDWPQVSWLLGSSVQPMPLFKDSRAFPHELSKSGARYFLSLGNAPMPGFTLVRRGGVNIYEREDDITAHLPSLLYLGDGWQNYLESLGDFRFALHSELGRLRKGRSLYADAYSPQQLAGRQAVLLFRFKWNDWEAMERTLSQYVKNGGTLLIDGSGNMEEYPAAHRLTNRSLLGMLVERRALRAKPRLSFSSDLNWPTTNFADFIDEGRGAWYGTMYRPADPDRSRILAFADGQPMLVEQRLGRGRIIWVGFNLFWHAFLTGNEEEKALVQRILTLALGNPSLFDFESTVAKTGAGPSLGKDRSLVGSVP